MVVATQERKQYTLPHYGFYVGFLASSKNPMTTRAGSQEKNTEGVEKGQQRQNKKVGL